MTRADQLLVGRALAPTRSVAQRLLASGAVQWRPAGGAGGAAGAVAGAAWDWRAVGKPGQDLPADCELRLLDDAESRWVSRAGLKLAGALAHTGLPVQGRICLDLGQSTGGFTEVLLERGAAQVVGVDVGQGQLAQRVRSHPRVVAVEGLNARHLTPHDLPVQRFDFIVADLSFISLTYVLPVLPAFGAADWLLLVKPQFELQPADIGKGGLVRDPVAAQARVRERLVSACEAVGAQVLSWFDSPVAGGDGNREYFLQARFPGSAA